MDITDAMDAMRPHKSPYARVMDLFNTGTTLTLEDDNGAFYLWVGALNQAHREEVARASAVALAAAKVLTSDNSSEAVLLRSELEAASVDELASQLVISESVELWSAGQDDVHASPKWRGDRLLLIEQGDEMLKSGGRLSEDPQRNTEMMDELLSLNGEYYDDWRQATMKRGTARKTELESLSKEELIRQYIDYWKKTRCSTIQMEEYNAQMLYYSTRICDSTDGKSHTDCNGHRDFFFPSIAATRDCSDAFRDQVLSAASKLDEAGRNALGK